MLSSASGPSSTTMSGGGGVWQPWHSIGAPSIEAPSCHGLAVICGAPLAVPAIGVISDSEAAHARHHTAASAVRARTARAKGFEGRRIIGPKHNSRAQGALPRAAARTPLRSW